MSTDAPWSPDGTQPPDDHTDPLLPAITDDMLPPLGLPRVPRLDDRALAEMLAELDGDDLTPAGSDTSSGPAPPTPSQLPPPSPAPPSPAPSPRPADSDRHRGSGPMPDPATRPVRRPAPPPTEGPTPESASRSDYGDFRPPVGRTPDGPSLIGLTRRSRSKAGSVAFTIVFVAIFLLILVQAVTSVLAAAGR